MDKHMLGFEREEQFKEAFNFLREQCPQIQKIGFLSDLLNIVDPNICAGLFERRPCKRKLKYIGDGHEFFEKGDVYQSIDFNGGTYSIVGYDSVIGCAYFEVVDI